MTAEARKYNWQMKRKKAESVPERRCQKNDKARRRRRRRLKHQQRRRRQKKRCTTDENHKNKKNKNIKNKITVLNQIYIYIYEKWKLRKEKKLLIQKERSAAEEEQVGDINVDIDTVGRQIKKRKTIIGSVFGSS